jgi:tRNA A-37 threonylcarbamoyl transferase component Bud32
MVGHQTEPGVSSELGLTQTSPIGHGADAVIELVENGQSIRKRYLDEDHDVRLERARREFEALQIASDVLQHLPGVTCPEPLEITENGDLIMSYCDGTRLDHALDRLGQETPIHFSRIAQQLRDAMLALGQHIPANQLDFSIRNTLVRWNPTSIVLIDFTPRALPESVPKAASATEIAVASFLTSVLTYQIRRSSIRDKAGANILREMARTIVSSPQSQQQIHPDLVRRASWAFYWRQSRNRGWMRYLWFHSAGIGFFGYLLRDVAPRQR